MKNILLVAILMVSSAAYANPFKLLKEINKEMIQRQKASQLTCVGNNDAGRKYAMPDAIRFKGKTNPWKDEWSEIIVNAILNHHPELVDDTLEISQQQISESHCPGYRYATAEQRAKFWALFMAIIAAKESAYDPTTELLSESETSQGLLQLGPGAKGVHKGLCKQIKIEEKEVTLNYGDLKGQKSVRKYGANLDDPKINLECSVTVLSNQFKGRVPNGKLNPLVQKRLYPPENCCRETVESKRIGWHWSVLSKYDTRIVILDKLKKYIDRDLPFCKLEAAPGEKKKCNAVVVSGQNVVKSEAESSSDSAKKENTKVQ